MLAGFIKLYATVRQNYSLHSNRHKYRIIIMMMMMMINDAAAADDDDNVFVD